MIRKTIYTITIVNMIFQIVYMLFGKYTTSELGIFKYIFYIFRSEYVIVSGLISLFVICVLIALIIKSIKKIRPFDVIMFALNIEYIVFYLKLMMRQ